MNEDVAVVINSRGLMTFTGRMIHSTVTGTDYWMEVLDYQQVFDSVHRTRPFCSVKRVMMSTTVSVPSWPFRAKAATVSAPAKSVPISKGIALIKSPKLTNAD